MWVQLIKTENWSTMKPWQLAKPQTPSSDVKTWMASGQKLSECVGIWKNTGCRQWSSFSTLLPKLPVITMTNKLSQSAKHKRKKRLLSPVSASSWTCVVTVSTWQILTLYGDLQWKKEEVPRRVPRVQHCGECRSSVTLGGAVRRHLLRSTLWPRLQEALWEVIFAQTWSKGESTQCFREAHQSWMHFKTAKSLFGVGVHSCPSSVGEGSWSHLLSCFQLLNIENWNHSELWIPLLSLTSKEKMRLIPDSNARTISGMQAWAQNKSFHSFHSDGWAGWNWFPWDGIPCDCSDIPKIATMWQT